MEKIIFITLLVSISILGCESNITEKKVRNCVYLRNTLGKIIIDFKNKRGYFPESFEKAHQDSNTVLSNRGDAFGNPVTYRKIGENSFSLESGGKTGFKVEYSNDSWSTPCI